MVSVPVGMSVLCPWQRWPFSSAASIDPELALTAGAQFVILSNQPGVRVECIAMQCLVGIERDAFAGNQCFLGCCSNVMEFGVGTCGMRMGWWGSCRWG